MRAGEEGEAKPGRCDDEEDAGDEAHEEGGASRFQVFVLTGHFRHPCIKKGSKKSPRASPKWIGFSLAIVFPALLVCYFGQGALYLERGAQVDNPFYEMVDGWLRYPVIAIATVATIVASQALVSGAYSLTRQAIQLGYCPRARRASAS